MSDDSVKELYRKWQREKSERARQDFFSAAWTRYHSRLQVFLTPWLGRGAECEDRVSEILLGAFERIETYNSRYAFSTWIYNLARKRCIDGLRKKRFVTEELAADHGGTGETPESLYMRNEDKRLVGEAINRLSAEDRELVFLYFYEEMKYREIAGITGKPLGTVKFRMSEIRKQMKSELSGSFV
ncbi:MAG: RNA polymerase sigma factor [Spirochaetales bacterium]|nr:RNA polymerase sigma factor [Spirochaetales bacterium]